MRLSHPLPVPSALCPPRAALFDLDGTLVRTFIDFPGMRQAMRELSARYGTTAETDASDDTLDIVARITAALGEERGSVVRAEAFAILEEIERAGCANAEPISGAVELLADLQAHGSRIGIITRNSRRIAVELAARMGLIWDLLVAREDSHAFKPDPEPLQVALRHFDLAPETATMTGDLWTDIAAGKAAGVGLTIGIQWAHEPPGRFSRCAPDIEVYDLASVRELLLP